MDDVTVTLEDHPNGELTNPIREGLISFNEDLAGPQGARHYALVVRRGDGSVSGGLIADEHWGWLYVAWLWLPESMRGHGLGSRLLQEAETIATAHGCRHAYLSTFDFQALPFYQQHGYVVSGTLDDFPVGSGFRRYYLQKRLTGG